MPWLRPGLPHAAGAPQRASSSAGRPPQPVCGPPACARWRRHGAAAGAGAQSGGDRRQPIQEGAAEQAQVSGRLWCCFCLADRQHAAVWMATTPPLICATLDLRAPAEQDPRSDAAAPAAAAATPSRAPQPAAAARGGPAPPRPWRRAGAALAPRAPNSTAACAPRAAQEDPHRGFQRRP